MKRAMIGLAGALLLCWGAQDFTTAHAAEASRDKKLRVVTTLFPLYDWARIVGGDQAHVVLLLPPGVEPHSFEPTPRDILGIHKADLLIYTGRFMEPWVDNIAKGVGHDRLMVVDTSRGILDGGNGHQEEHPHGHHPHSDQEDPHHRHDHAHEHHAGHSHDHSGPGGHRGGQDPHIWLEFGNAQIMVDTIARAFARKDPQRAQLYLDRASEYKSGLKKLDAVYEKNLAACRHKTLIYGGHFAFGYFAQRYGLTHVSPYQGFSPDAEPTPRAIAELIATMRETGMNAVFYEEGLQPRVARAIGKETGARLLLLHGAHNVTKDELAGGATYLSIMEDNLERLKEGLECP